MAIGGQGQPQLGGVQAGLTELRNRLLFVLFALLVYRIGTHIPAAGHQSGRGCAPCSSRTRAESSTCSTCSPAARLNA